MKIVPLKCMVYNCDDSVTGDTGCSIETLFIDIEKISAFHAGEDNTTIVYCEGVTHELLIPVDRFASLKMSDNLTPPAKDRFITMFSNN